MKTRLPVRTHVFHSDGIRIHPLRPDTGCLRCEQPERHPVHRVPDRHAAQAAVRARFGDVDD
jgi:hypothetical protein